jgi:hypothetical protein
LRATPTVEAHSRSLVVTVPPPERFAASDTVPDSHVVSTPAGSATNADPELAVLTFTHVLVAVFPPLTNDRLTDDVDRPLQLTVTPSTVGVHGALTVIAGA